MANGSIVRPLIAVVGPTASGKTGLSMKLASRFGGEIVAADSRSIYRGLDIGTAKPTKEQQATVPHWGLDLVNPDERYSAMQFQSYAYGVIDDIRRRKKSPLLVGGTGLYINSVVYNYSFVKIDQGLKSRLELMSVGQLQDYCVENNTELPENHSNKRHLVNQILRQGRLGKRSESLAENVHVVGIATDSKLLKQRIYERAALILDSGAIEEATRVASRYGWDAPGLSGNVYQVARQLLAGELTPEGAIERSATLDWQLARRQMTWFRRDPNIKWLELGAAEHYISDILASE